MNTNTGTFTILDSVDSSNNYAMQQVHAGSVTHGDAWFAIEQTGGKGRRGKHWISNKGENIALTIVLDASFLPLHQQFRLSVTSSLACYDLIHKYAKENTKIKWPNDLFWNDRKAGGILIENKVIGNICQWSAIGIGINVNQTTFPQGIDHATSLKLVTGNTFDPINLGRELHDNLMLRLNELRASDFTLMLNEYNERLYKKNEKVRLKKQNVIFETTITGVLATGQLQTTDGMEHQFDFDEIEWML